MMTWIVLMLVSVFSAVFRLLPHAPNFTPIGALALCAGAFAPKRWGIVIPLVVMLASDFFVGSYDLRIMASVYGSFLVMGLLGFLLRTNRNPLRVALASLSGSTFFFLVTNFAVWAFSSMYPKTLAGLEMSYTLALPFFRNTLSGDIFFAFLFFGAYELVRAAAVPLAVRPGVAPARTQ